MQVTTNDANEPSETHLLKSQELVVLLHIAGWDHVDSPENSRLFSSHLVQGQCLVLTIQLQNTLKTPEQAQCAVAQILWHPECRELEGDERPLILLFEGKSNRFSRTIFSEALHLQVHSQCIAVASADTRAATVMYSKEFTYYAQFTAGTRFPPLLPRSDTNGATTIWVVDDADIEIHSKQSLFREVTPSVPR